MTREEKTGPGQSELVLYQSDDGITRVHVHERAIDPRWDDAIELLLDGHSHRLVAERAGVHRNTSGNWMRAAAFRLELARRSDDRLAAAKQRLAILTTRLWRGRAEGRREHERVRDGVAGTQFGYCGAQLKSDGTSVYFRHRPDIRDYCTGTRRRLDLTITGYRA